MEGVEVEIIGDHPHRGRRGQPTGKMITLGGFTQMFEIVFPEGDYCFAEYSKMRLLRPFCGRARPGYRIEDEP